MFIDTHAHLYSEDFGSDTEAVITRAREAGIVGVVMPSISRDEFLQLKALWESYPDDLHAAIGLHPSYVKGDFREELAFVLQQSKCFPWVAVGEVGLDYYWSRDFVEEQQEALRLQLRLALELDLPVIFHVRDAFADVFSILREPEFADIRGVMHSFTGTKEELEEVLTFPKLYVGINGVVTFKNANLRDYIGMIPLDRLLLETDAPYLSPTPLRGKRNEPLHMLHTASHIAPLWGITVEVLGQVTSENAIRLFNLPVRLK